MPSPILPQHPLDHPGSIKIMLGRDASEAIAANGDFHLAMISHPDATSPPEANGRLILVCIPLDKATLDAAARVALRKARAVTIKSPATPATQ
jgi:hypothetical protein